MKAAVPLAAVAALIASSCATPGATGSGVFVVPDRNGRWCAFDNAWPAELVMNDAVGASFVYALFSADGRAEEVVHSYGAPSGEWAVTDLYQVEGARVLSLRRTVYVGEGTRKTQVFVRQGDRMVLADDMPADSTRFGDPPAADLSTEPYYAPMIGAAGATRPLPDTGLCASAGR